MKDWRSMEAGPALDRLIARYIYDIEVQPTERPLYRYLDSDDQPFGDWKSSTDMLKPPPYSTSVDAALTLPLEDNYCWKILTWEDGKESFVQIEKFGQRVLPGEMQHNVAHGMALVWLAYMDSKEAVHDV